MGALCGDTETELLGAGVQSGCGLGVEGRGASDMNELFSCSVLNYFHLSTAVGIWRGNK